MQSDLIGLLMSEEPDCRFKIQETAKRTGGTFIQAPMRRSPVFTRQTRPFSIDSLI